jgi:hypothetical protein
MVEWEREGLELPQASDRAAGDPPAARPHVARCLSSSGIGSGSSRCAGDRRGPEVRWAVGDPPAARPHIEQCGSSSGIGSGSGRCAGDRRGPLQIISRS